MTTELPRPELQPISLTFHLSCWQNRRARIYVDGVTLDQFSDTLDVASFAKHLVLSGKDLLPLPLGELNGRSSLFYHHSTSFSPICQLSPFRLRFSAFVGASGLLHPHPSSAGTQLPNLPPSLPTHALLSTEALSTWECSLEEELLLEPHRRRFGARLAARKPILYCWRGFRGCTSVARFTRTY